MSIQSVIVVGAGSVGLATAWYLQRRGIEVAVLDRRDVAAGSSAGNAGWLTPSLVLPLAEPAVLRSGLSMMLSASSPLYIPPTVDPRLWRFLVGFLRHCTPRAWHRTATILAAAGARMMAPYEEMCDSAEAPVAVPVNPAQPMLAAFASSADRDALVREFDDLATLGFAPRYDLLDAAATRATAPVLSGAATCSVAIADQRFINPSRFVRGIADAVRAGGGEISGDSVVTAVTQRGGHAQVSLADGSTRDADAVVIANGSWMDALVRPHGVRTVVQAGRGYSFTVYPDELPANPLYLQAQRVACTPLGGAEDGLRVAGMMEFRAADAPLDPRRIQAIIASASQMLTGIDWSARSDEWVGARPCTADGLPLIGRTRSDRVFVAGGHGMWGIALGPLTGKLLAERIVDGRIDPLLSSCDPLRKGG